MDLSVTLNQIAKQLITFDDGDVMTLASWVQTLDDLATTLKEPWQALVRALGERVRSALRGDMPEDFLNQMSADLDQLTGALDAQNGAPAVAEDTSGRCTDSLWDTHGPMFLSETKARLARVEELVLGSEQNPDCEVIGDLFRLFHTIKGEAGFLQRDDLVAAVHGTEGLLDELRSGSRLWDRSIADRLLADVDHVRALLVPRTAKPGSATLIDAQQILRVPSAKIDALVAQVGELLVALESEGTQASPAVRKLSRGLQQSALQLRTEPLRGLMAQIHRGARDLAQNLGKPVEVTLTGEGLEIDRNLAARLEEPLMHLVRNALDHGLESREVRRQGHKPVVGSLAVAARRRGNRIEIEVSDDGAGLDATKIWAKAVKMGLTSGPQPEVASEVYPWIFHPGFSTAEGLSTVSGRGVGMDIVSRMVREARGKVEVASEPGRGTKVGLSFPLSTAVLDGLVVRIGTRRFIVPVHSARESLIVPAGSLRTLAPGTKVYSLRGTPLEVFSLAEVLDRRPPGTEPLWGLVLETSHGRQRLMLVDEIEAKREVVIRSLGVLFQGLRGVSAATVLGGGRLALVLDVDQLVELAEALA